MGQGRQHLIHRAIDIYLKDIHRTQHLRDEAGGQPVRECRNHKNRNWRLTVQDKPGHERQTNGQTRTMEGRKAREHEDLLIEIRGHDWEEDVDNNHNIEDWMKKMRPYISSSLQQNKRLQDPKYEAYVAKQ